jgi:hypothetical protein
MLLALCRRSLTHLASGLFLYIAYTHSFTFLVDQRTPPGRCYRETHKIFRLTRPKAPESTRVESSIYLPFRRAHLVVHQRQYNLCDHDLIQWVS